MRRRFPILSGVARLTEPISLLTVACLASMPKVGPLPSAVISGFTGTTGPSDSRPTHRPRRRLPLAIDRASHVAQRAVHTCRCHYPGGRRGPFGCAARAATAFAPLLEARRPRLRFRGLLGIHSRYGPCGCSPGSDRSLTGASTRRVTPTNRPAGYRGVPTTPRADLASAGPLHLRDAQQSQRR